MENEELQTNNVTEDYIAKIQELKNSTVSRNEYDSLRADNKRLLDAIVNGQGHVTDNQPAPEPEVDVQALRNRLYGGKFDGTDLEYWTKTLQLRSALMKQGYEDPAVGRGSKTTPTEIDYQLCQQTCDAIQEMVDFADGDPAVFRAEYMRRVKF